MNKKDDLLLKVIDVESIDESVVIGINKKNNQRVVYAILNVTPIYLERFEGLAYENILNQFRYFLRSLEFPIQICSRSVNVDLPSYMKKWSAKQEKKLKEYKDADKLLAEFHDYETWRKRLIEYNCRPGEVKYLVIPYDIAFSPDENKKELERIFKIINSRVEFAKGQIASWSYDRDGVKESFGVKRLGSQSLRNLFNSYLSDSVYLSGRRVYNYQNDQVENELGIYLNEMDLLQKWVDWKGEK